MLPVKRVTASATLSPRGLSRSSICRRAMIARMLRSTTPASRGLFRRSGAYLRCVKSTPRYMAKLPEMAGGEGRNPLVHLLFRKGYEACAAEACKGGRSRGNNDGKPRKPREAVRLGIGLRLSATHSRASYFRTLRTFVLSVLSYSPYFLTLRTFVLFHRSARYSWIEVTATEPSPTAEPTRFTAPART